MSLGMIVPQIARWGHTPIDIYRLAVEHPHPRTRERYLALSKVLDGLAPWRVATAIGRSEKAVYTWLKRYNEAGPAGIEYRRTGGRRPAFQSSGG
jgi:transposase